MSVSGQILIIGGGVIGTSAAYYLAKRGSNVTLLDRGNFDTCCSTGNAGIIALGHPPMPRPGLVGQTMRMLFNPLNPLYIPPRLDRELISWMWRFRKACSSEHFERSMKALAELGFAAGEAFDALIDDENIQCEYHRTGWLDVFGTESRFSQGRAEAELIRSYGYDVHVLSGTELRFREPAFKEGIVGAAHYTDSRFANPGLFLREIAHRARQQGAALRNGVEVRSIERKGDTCIGVVLETGERLSAQTIILAGGIWSSQLARRIGVNIPMQPGKGYHMNVLLPETSPRVSTTSVLAESFVAVTPITPLESQVHAAPGSNGTKSQLSRSNALRLAGTVEFSGMNHNLVHSRLDMLRRGAREYLHGIDQAEVHSTWCGLRPCTADGLPVIGWASEVANLYIATGHAMMGFALGPITGRIICESLLEGEPSVDIRAFSPARYAKGVARQEARHCSESVLR